MKNKKAKTSVNIRRLKRELKETQEYLDNYRSARLALVVETDTLKRQRSEAGQRFLQLNQLISTLMDTIKDLHGSLSVLVDLQRKNEPKF